MQFLSSGYLLSVEYSEEEGRRLLKVQVRGRPSHHNCAEHFNIPFIAAREKTRRRDVLLQRTACVMTCTCNIMTASITFVSAWYNSQNCICFCSVKCLLVSNTRIYKYQLRAFVRSLVSNKMFRGHVHHRITHIVSKSFI